MEEATNPTSPLSEETSVILDSINDGVFTVNDAFAITSFNQAAEAITGVPRDEALGKPCCDVFHASICENACALRETMRTGRPIQCRPIHIVRPDGRRVPLSISTALLRDAEGQIIGGVETFRDLSVVEDLRRELTRHHTFHDIISKSHRMQRLFDILPDVAASDSTVLIEGPSGSGKELVARAIHSLSPRASGPLVTVNCGALPDTLLESELFGHVRGAFTDAKMDRRGRFALAEGGTIFLDEIGDVSPAMQVRLLRVLQERTYEPVGSSQSQRADVRVIAATHRSLRDEVEAGRFREDLFYRINVVRLEIPPLSERREDIPLLVEHFLERFNRLQSKRITGLSDEALAALVRHRWPGNVRELENALEHAFILSRGPVIQPEHLPPEIVMATARPEEIAAAPMGRTLEELEAQIILAALRRHGWHRLETARELGINKTTLWRKMKRLGIQLPTTVGG
ncbi:sigma 54-interacting transcriptional regulator [Candidatus Sumerlaeota bacterium]|nr:sigma 54-interacting transcriptional regulator [Candidatus Sumerlaeota bacterium]